MKTEVGTDVGILRNADDGEALADSEKVLLRTLTSSAVHCLAMRKEMCCTDVVYTRRTRNLGLSAVLYGSKIVVEACRLQMCMSVAVAVILRHVVVAQLTD